LTRLFLASCTALELIHEPRNSRLSPALSRNSAAQVVVVGLAQLMRRYQDYRVLMDAQPFLRELASYKPVLDVQAFAQGPGDIAVFATI
jgi:hypothetical protein